MFCLAVATEAPNDLKNPVSLSTSYRSLQPLKNSATSCVPTYPPTTSQFIGYSTKASKHASRQASEHASKQHIYRSRVLWLRMTCLGLNKDGGPSAGLSTSANCIVQAKFRDTDCIVVHNDANLGPIIFVSLMS